MLWLRSTVVALTKFITGAKVVALDDRLNEDVVRVYFANHCSHLDYAAVYASLPISVRHKARPVAARDYWMRNSFTRFFSKHMTNALLSAREGITREDNPVAQMAVALREGWSLILFPEGTRSTTGQVAPFKPGLYHLAAKVPEAQFIPVYLQNLNRILPKGHLLPVPVMSNVVFGHAIRLEDGEKKLAFLARAREAVLNLASHTANGSPTTPVEH